MNELLEKLRAQLSSLQIWFNRLTQRERVMVSATSGVALFLFLFVVFFTLGSSATAIRKRTEKKLQQLEQAQALATNYHEAEQARQAAESELRNSNVNLISYVEDKGNVAHIDIPAVTPVGDATLGQGHIIQSSVETNLSDIKLGQLLDFLGAIERGPGVVKVTSLRLEPHVAGGNLSAFTTISTYKLKESP